MESLKNWTAPSHWCAAFVSLLVGFTGSVAILYQAVEAASQADPSLDASALLESWLLALGIGMGLPGIFFSLRYKQPIVVAWSTPGAAFLITALPGIPYAEAIGAFMVSSFLITIVAVTGSLDRLGKLLPPPIAAALLAGILMPILLKGFEHIATEPDVILVLLACFFAGKVMGWSLTIPMTVLIGCLYVMMTGQMEAVDITLSLAKPIWVMPEMNIATIIGVALPLFLITTASQNLPGMAVLRSHGYDAPISPPIAGTGLYGLVTAPLGSYALSMAAITAAITMGDDVDKDPGKRYRAAVLAGLLYACVGIFAGTVAQAFSALPVSLIAGMAAIALIGVVMGSLKQAMSDDGCREAAIVTFVIAACDFQIFSIAAPFWALIVGVFFQCLLTMKKKVKG